MPRPGPGQRTPGSGRAPGTPNGDTKAIRDLVRAALDKAGGLDYLTEQAKANPQAFLTLIGKLIPAELIGSLDVNLGFADALKAARARVIDDQL